MRQHRRELGSGHEVEIQQCRIGQVRVEIGADETDKWQIDANADAGIQEGIQPTPVEIIGATLAEHGRGWPMAPLGRPPFSV